MSTHSIGQKQGASLFDCGVGSHLNGAVVKLIGCNIGIGRIMIEHISQRDQSGFDGFAGCSPTASKNNRKGPLELIGVNIITVF